MLFPIRRRHQQLDVFSRDLRDGIAEQPFRGRAERLNGAALVDDDHGFGNGVENRLHMRLARARLRGARQRRHSSAVQQFAPPCRTEAHQRECHRIDHVHRRWRANPGDENKTDRKAEKSGKSAWPNSAEGRSDQDRRYEEQISGLTLKDGSERKMQSHRYRSGCQGGAIGAESFIQRPRMHPPHWRGSLRIEPAFIHVEIAFSKRCRPVWTVDETRGIVRPPGNPLGALSEFSACRPRVTHTSRSSRR